MEFAIKAPFEPAGDQPQAIAKLAQGVEQGMKAQVLLGATGTGKTFTVAQVINRVQKPTLVIAHNKTLAAQLASELKAFFPDIRFHFRNEYGMVPPNRGASIAKEYKSKAGRISRR